MNGMVRMMLVAGAGAVVCAAGTPVRASEAAAPAITMVYPSSNNQLVTTMRNSELHPVLGSVYSPNGINRCTVYIKRLSDSYYWNGSTWVSFSVGLSATVTPKSPSPPWFDFRYDAGPNAANIIDGSQYLVKVECWDDAAGYGSTTVTVIGED